MIETRPVATHEQAAAKARVLIEALPWMNRFQDKIVVVKFGGNAMVDPALLRAFAEDIVFMRHAGLRPVVVHGGGPQINAMLKKLEIPSKFRGGYRVTTPEAMEVVRMVLTGKVNPSLVDAFSHHGPYAVGLSGEDAGIFEAQRRAPIQVDGESVDLGCVGDIVSVRPDAVKDLTAQGFIPIISSIAPDMNQPGRSLNINADAAASALAIALGAEKLLMLTDVPGLYAQWPDTSEIVSSLTASDLEGLLPGLESGMIPKMRACSDAVNQGIAAAAIIDGREPHSVLLEIFTREGIGTQVVPDTPVVPHTASVPIIPPDPNSK